MLNVSNLQSYAINFQDKPEFDLNDSFDKSTFFNNDISDIFEKNSLETSDQNEDGSSSWVSDTAQSIMDFISDTVGMFAGNDEDSEVSEFSGAEEADEGDEIPVLEPDDVEFDEFDEGRLLKEFEAEALEEEIAAQETAQASGDPSRSSNIIQLQQTDFVRKATKKRSTKSTNSKKKNKKWFLLGCVLIVTLLVVVTTI